MPAKHNIDQIILGLLEEDDLSRQEISKKVKKVLGKSVSDKSINEALMKLLADNKILVIDYDLSVYDGVERIQSIKSDGIVFTLHRKDPVEISILFKKMESTNIAEVEKAVKKLRKFFKKKMALAGLKDYSLFNRMIHEIFIIDPKNKDKIIGMFSWALSDEEGSLEKFEDLILYLMVREHIK